MISPNPKCYPILDTSNQKYMQFGALQKELSQLRNNNKKLYQQIIEYRPDFGYKPINIAENKSVSLNFGRELIMKQIDKLMEEESYLNK